MLSCDAANAILGINFSSCVKTGCPVKKVLLFMLDGFKCGNSKLPIQKEVRRPPFYLSKIPLPDSNTILLWQVEGFYVEVFYDGVENEIIKIRSFISTYGPEPYLKQRDLTITLT
jgi:hypothetical protein